MIWSLLAEGMRDASSPFHTLALVTIADDGPEVRTVVLRRVLREKREISCHTDWRSPRRLQIETHSIVSWLFYDRARKLQLRVRGWAYLHHNTDVTRERWERIAPHCRRCYASPLAPGVRLTAPIEAPTDADSGWGNFRMLNCRMYAMDWLFLRAAGHRRVVLHWQYDRLVAHWVAP